MMLFIRISHSYILISLDVVQMLFRQFQQMQLFATSKTFIHLTEGILMPDILIVSELNLNRKFCTDTYTAIYILYVVYRIREFHVKTDVDPRLNRMINSFVGIYIVQAKRRLKDQNGKYLMFI